MNIKSWIISVLIVMVTTGAQAAGTNMTPVYLLLLNGDNQQTFEINVTKTGNGMGTVTSIPAGDIDCGTDCSQTYAVVTDVTLKAVADAGSVFNGWSGPGTAGCNAYDPCEVTVDQAVTVSADFTTASQKVLKVNNDTPPAGGTVTSQDGGITCDGPTSDCNEFYDHGTQVTLTAHPLTNFNFIFMGWQVGGTNPAECSANLPTCTVTMDESKNVTPVFQALVPVPETDPGNTGNNNAGDAESMQLDSVISGKLGAPADQDWFKVNADTSKTVTVHFKIPSPASGGPYYWQIEVWQEATPDDVLITVVTVGVDDIFKVDLPASGNYYFAVVPPEQAAQYDSADYELALLSNDGFIVDPAESEPNNDKLTADSLALETTMNGSLMALVDQDWYEVTVPAGTDTVSIDFSANGLYDSGGTAIEPKGNWVLSVYKTDGTTLLAEAEVTGDSPLTVSMPAAGSPYYVQIRDFDNSAHPTLYNGAPYTLTVTPYEGGKIAEQEPNETTGTATDVGGVNTIMTGQLMSSTDEDWYQFYNGYDNTSLSVELTTDVTILATWEYALYDSSGVLIQSATWSPYASGSFTAILPTAGNYYIAVRRDLLSYFNRSQYDVTLQEVP